MDSTSQARPQHIAGAVKFGRSLYPCEHAVTDQMPESSVAQYHTNAARYWDHFYRANQRNFFKDRHYLDREFPVLMQNGLVMLEVCLSMASGQDHQSFNLGWLLLNCGAWKPLQDLGFTPGIACMATVAMPCSWVVVLGILPFRWRRPTQCSGTSIHVIMRLRRYIF